MENIGKGKQGGKNRRILKEKQGKENRTFVPLVAKLDGFRVRC